MAYKRRRRNYYVPQEQQQIPSAMDQARMYNTEAAAFNQQLMQQRNAALEEEQTTAALAQRKKEVLASALGIPLREKYFNDSLGVESSRPIASRRNLTEADLQSRFQGLPGYEQERIARSGAIPDGEKIISNMQNEREKGLGMQVNAFAQDLASGKIFHQKTASGKHELMQMADDPNASDEDRLLGKVKKVPVPISLGQRALFIEAMRRKALPEGMEAFQIEGLHGNEAKINQFNEMQGPQMTSPAATVAALPQKSPALRTRSFLTETIPNTVKEVGEYGPIMAETFVNTVNKIRNIPGRMAPAIGEFMTGQPEVGPTIPTYPDFNAQEYFPKDTYNY